MHVVMVSVFLWKLDAEPEKKAVNRVHGVVVSSLYQWQLEAEPEKKEEVREKVEKVK